MDLDTFDYVIVGGGTAGLVLAARLTEDPAVDVVVLEAGEKRLDDPNINIPGLMGQLYGNEKYDWNFKTTPQEGLSGRTLAWPRGKVLGGSSAINFLMVSHASRADLDNWEKLGNAGRNFDTLQPYYRKSETYNPPDEVTTKELGTDIIDPALHGTSGPIQTSFPIGQGPLDQAWGPTFKTLGLDPKEDPRKGDTLGGYSLLKFMDGKARRSYTAPAYYIPNAERPNLVVLTNALVKKIEFEDSVATGVRYSVSGEEKFVRTRGEIVLSAGTVQSPQILELSGIGSRSRLEALGIDIVVDNPNVGENLQDHPLLGIGYEAMDGIPTAEMLKQPGVLDWAIKEWAEKGAGPLAGGVTGTAFLSYASILTPDKEALLEQRVNELISQAESPSSPVIAKQLELQKAMLLNSKEAAVQYNFGATGVNVAAGNDIGNLFNHGDAGGYAGIVAALTHAFSRGSIHIKSTDPEEHPAIDPRYMTHPLDVEIFADSLVFTQNIASAAPLSSLLKDNDAGTGKRIQPSFNIPGRLDKEMAVKLVRASTITSFHPTSTCSMLPEGEGGVVDDRLKVYEIKNLRVVDASIVPLMVRGNIASLVYALSERAADLIKEDRKAERLSYAVAA
ncbi:Dehydrogenase citC [Lachnellula suecica]|uniref:Dehydrogenase citC n=1 Tax=Lachnellula suecica TaxID=602035 RepID=A0A8T9BXP2_9HELO|nr:Dehydrogenase citC [Lachnellula suecica]